MQIINCANDLNKKDKLKVLFLKLNILQKLSRNYVDHLLNKEKKVKNTINIIFCLNLLILLSFTNIFTIIFCLTILLLNIYASLLKETITVYLMKGTDNNIIYSLENDKFLKISSNDEFLLNSSLNEYIKTFNLKELIELSKEEFFKNENNDLKSLLKREKINIPEIQDILSSNDYLEYILLDKKDNDIYNFVADIYNIDNQKLKNYIRENYKSEFVLNNKEKIKELLNKEKDYFSYEIIILNKN